MTKQEFLAISLPYGLKCKEVDLNEEFHLTPKKSFNSIQEEEKFLSSLEILPKGTEIKIITST